MKADLKTITDALESLNPGIFLRESARAALGRVKEHINYERTQREFLIADLTALAEGKPVTSELAKKVEARIAALQEEVSEAREDAAASAGAYR